MSSNTLQRIGEAYSLFDRAMNGGLRARADVMESFTTSDFPVLLGQAYNRKLLAEYQAIAPVWQQYATRTTVPNFKQQKLVQILGGKRGLSKVAEATEYPHSDLGEAEFDFSVVKYGDRFGLSWEMFVNDELGAFRNLDQRLATEARETEGITAAGALLNANRTGLNTQFFRAANGNAPESEPLSRAALKEALQGIAQKKNSNGQTLIAPRMKLVVPPTLEFEAKEIVNAEKVETRVGDVTTTASNALAGAVDVVVDPNLLINTGANAATTWFLLPAPNTARPAVVAAFLAGHESPDLRVKADTGTRAGGGSIAPEQGSFDDDTVQYRARHVFGAAAVDPTFTFASTGA